MEVQTKTINYQDKEITLIPTAHVSKESSQLVERVIDEIQPDSICIELDNDRYQSLLNPDKFKNMDIVKVIKEKRVALLLVNLILSNYQRKLAIKLDSTSGNEMLVGINKAKELNSNLVLADRNITTTFKRVWANLNGKDKLKLIETIISSLFDKEEVSEEDLMNLQQQDALESAIAEISQQFPSLAKPLVDERDQYLAYKIKNAPGKKIVAILGAAHTINVPKYIHEDYSIDQLDIIPAKKLSSKIVGWLIPVAIVITIIFSFRFDGKIGLQQVLTWIIFNGGLAALGTLASGGNILSILTAFITAPFTSLNPIISSGLIAGIVESRIKKPTVADFEDLTNINSFKDFYHNKVCKILLIVLMANLGSTIGTFLSSIDIFKNLIKLIAK